MNFCNNCHNCLTNVYTTDSKLIFRCLRCNIDYDSSPDDTLIISKDDNVSDNSMLQKYVQYAHYDDTIVRVNKECPGCNHPIAKRLMIGTDEKIIYICVSCQNKFV
jgi:DNA-directed RNA polymerase subunit M/transcription elongation factor TFIIS